MVNISRDEFTVRTKKTLAERVAWVCSFPGCGRQTIGPDSHDPTRAINIGIAAHIHAASPRGARYKKEMSREERRHISNGIWMCRDHGHLIDADITEYSPDTLRSWKREAERRAAEILKLPTDGLFPDGSTLVQLGSRNIFHATWEKVNHRKWGFVLMRPELGNLQTLTDCISALEPSTENDAYIVVESQGDARRINDASLRKSQSGQHVLEVNVQKRIPPTDPNTFGASFKIGPDYDICIGDGLIRGVEAAKQHIMITMGVVKGEIKGSEDVGSLVSEYYSKYSDDLELLSRLIKMEFIRLSLIPNYRQIEENESKPSLHFVKRFVNVRIDSKQLSHSRLAASVDLEWGNGENWSGIVPLFVLPQE